MRGEIYGADGRRSPKERDREAHSARKGRREREKRTREEREREKRVYSRTWNKIVQSLHKTLERASKAGNEIPRFAGATT